ncbi:MAG: hypothetical protein KGL95_11770 [Patescibacteria group bacterium]|nr:hypothetical protein [Patescibacteria group bacterium]
MSVKTFLTIAGFIFSLVGLLHLLRLLTGFQVILGGWALPLWLSIFGVILPWYLAYNAFMFARKKTKK